MIRGLFVLIATAGINLGCLTLPALALDPDRSAAARKQINDANLDLFNWCSALGGAGRHELIDVNTPPPHPLDPVDREAIAHRFGLPLQTEVVGDTSEAQLGYAGWWRMPVTGEPHSFLVIAIERLAADELIATTVLRAAGNAHAARRSYAWNGLAYRHHITEATQRPMRHEYMITLSGGGGVSFFVRSSWSVMENGVEIGEGFPLCLIRADR